MVSRLQMVGDTGRGGRSRTQPGREAAGGAGKGIYLYPGSCQSISDKGTLAVQSTLQTCASQFPWGKVVVRNIPSFASGNSVWDDDAVIDPSPAFQLQFPSKLPAGWDFLGCILTTRDVRIADIIPTSLDLPFASPCYPSHR